MLVSYSMYGGTHRLVSRIFQKYGINFVFCDMCDGEDVERQLKKGAALLLAESVTNPDIKVCDISLIAFLCKKHGTLFAVDNTFLTPYFQTPLSLGADIVIHSATKYLSGHHDTVSGVMAVNDALLAEKLELISKTLGNALSPFDCWLVLRGIRTLPLRMERHQKNAFALAEYLLNCGWAEKVMFPGLPSHPRYELCKKQSRGAGGIISFYTQDDKTAKKLKKGGSIIRFAESLGGPHTLMTHPLTQTHATLTQKEKDKLGINCRLFRLSAGLEHHSDIIDDLKQMTY